jgi:hypothetical protein
MQMATIYEVPPGSTLTATVFDGTGYVRQVENPAIAGLVTNAAPLVFGPYIQPRQFRVSGDVAVSIAEVAAFSVPGVGLPANVVDMFGEGAPVAPVQASLLVNPAGDDNAILYTAAAYGAAGNAISVEYIDPGVDDAVLAVTAESNALKVYLETDENGDIVTTAADIVTAVEASDAAMGFLTLAIDATDEDSGGGVGVVAAAAAAVLEGGVGTGIGTAGAGSRYTATGETPAVYMQTGPIGQPAWVQLAEVS